MAYAMHRVFCAAPEGLDAECRAFHNLISEVNADLAAARGVLFIPVTIVERVKKLVPFWKAIEQNVRDAGFYVQMLAGSFGAPERNIAPLLDLARATLDPANIAVLLKTLPPGSPVDADAARFRSDPGVPCSEYRDLDELSARLRSVLRGWLARIAGFDLRPATAADEAFLYALVTGAMAERLAASAWEPALRDTLLRMQYEAARRGYAAAFPDAEHSIVMVEGRPAGHTIVARSDEALRIVDITLAPEFRGRGLGAAVLRTYLEEADRTGRRVRLQVTLTNPAIRLYQRLGFEPVAGDEVNLEMERGAGSQPAVASQAAPAEAGKQPAPGPT